MQLLPLHPIPHQVAGGLVLGFWDILRDLIFPSQHTEGPKQGEVGRGAFPFRSLSTEPGNTFLVEYGTLSPPIQHSDPSGIPSVPVLKIPGSLNHRVRITFPNQA